MFSKSKIFEYYQKKILVTISFFSFLFLNKYISRRLHLFNQIGKVSGEMDPPKFDVTGLEEGEEYLFRVTAINDEGESEPLVADAAIKAKNPFGNFHLKQIKTNKQHYCNILRHAFVGWRNVFEPGQNFSRLEIKILGSIW